MLLCVACATTFEADRVDWGVQGERDYIMREILNAAADPDIKVRRVAYECLVVVADNYYDKLPGYIVAIYEVPRGFPPLSDSSLISNLTNKPKHCAI